VLPADSGSDANAIGCCERSVVVIVIAVVSPTPSAATATQVRVRRMFIESG
jgi:hypothetical protein